MSGVNATLVLRHYNRSGADICTMGHAGCFMYDGGYEEAMSFGERTCLGRPSEPKRPEVGIRRGHFRPRSQQALRLERPRSRSVSCMTTSSGPKHKTLFASWSRPFDSEVGLVCHVVWQRMTTK